MERDEVEQRVRALCSSGEFKAAATVAIEELGPEILGFLVVMVGHSDDAGDVFTETCTRLWKSLRTFRWDSSLRTWTYLLARRSVYAYRKERDRRGQRGQHIPISEVSEVDDVIVRVRTSTLARLREQRDAFIEGVRAQLSAEEQALLTLRIDRELEWRDIARILADEDSLDEDTLARESAALRKKFERLKDKLRKLAPPDLT